MPENFVSVIHPGWSRFPPFTKTGSQKFICVWLVIPNGDRRNRSQSGCAVHNYEAIAPRYDYIMAVLVLHYNIGDDLGKNPSFRLFEAPVKNVS